MENVRQSLLVRHPNIQVGRCAIDRAYFAPVIEIISMLTEYGKECGVKVIKLEKPGRW